MGNINHARYLHTATTLQNGKILLVGGFSSGNTRSIAELYDPNLGMFTDTGSTTVPTVYHTATLLNNGLVLIAGGNQGNGSNYLATAELYDSTTGLFTATGSLHTARQEHGSALLNDGTVLVAGGYNGAYLASAEIYNPVTKAFAVTGNLNTARIEPFMPSVPLLGNAGTVLIAGGRNSVTSRAPSSTMERRRSRVMSIPSTLWSASPMRRLVISAPSPMDTALLSAPRQQIAALLPMV